jgi:hypothetical protein
MYVPSVRAFSTNNRNSRPRASSCTTSLVEQWIPRHLRASVAVSLTRAPIDVVHYADLSTAQLRTALG